MKDRIVQIPREPKKLTTEDQILIITDKPMSGMMICKIINNKLNNVYPVISRMVRDGKLKSFNCPTCDAGKMYVRVKNVP